MLVADLVREVVNGLQINLKFYSVTVTEGNYLCKTHDTQWLRTGTKVNLGGNEYEVVSFDLNKELVLSGDTSPLTNFDYSLGVPSYLHGKLKQTSNEINQRLGTDIQVTYPLLWLFELSPRTTPQEVDTILETTGSVKIFFMNTDDYANLNTNDRYKEVINPVNNLVSTFIKALKRHKRSGKVFESARIVHPKFTNDTGATDSSGNNILPEELSGIEVDIIIPIKRSLVCPVKEFPQPEGGGFDSGFDTGFDISIAP